MASVVKWWARAVLLWAWLCHAMQQSHGQSSSNARLRIEFSEGAVVGSRRLLELEPALLQGVKEAHLEGNRALGTFRLHQAKDQSGFVSYLHLETVGPLDRESQAFYELQVRLSPGSRRADLHVAILDINDNPPGFEVPPEGFSVHVNRSVDVNHLLAVLTAQDPDEGENARITYQLEADEQDDLIEDYFQLNSGNGELRTRRKLDCQDDNDRCPKCLHQGVCSFLVHARDHGVPQHSGYTEIRIHLVQQNDHDPHIGVRYFPDHAQPFSLIERDVAPGTSVAALTVSDRDSGPNGETRLTLVSGNPDGFFHLVGLSPSLYVLRVAPRARLPPSITNKVVLRIRAEDLGQPPKSDETDITIRIQEANKHEPKFDQPQYETELLESSPVGFSVLQVHARDLDKSSKLTYALSGDQASYFQIFPESGLIITGNALDRESHKSLEVQVEVSDGASKAKTVLKVNLKDVNDNPPVFDNGSSDETFVSEDVSPGTVVYTARASDQDELFGTVSYHLVKKSAYFSIDKTLGTVKVVRRLDRERLKQHQLQIQAVDNGTPALSSIFNLTVQVTDVNDNSPFFYPKDVLLKMASSSRLPNQTLYLASAEDPDEDSTLRYSWKQPEKIPDNFALDPSTGEVTYQRDLFSTVPRNLEIVATDQGGRVSPQSLTLHLVSEVLEHSQVKRYTVEEDVTVLDTLSTLVSQPGEFFILDGDASGHLTLDNDTTELKVTSSFAQRTFHEQDLRVGYISISNEAEVLNMHVTYKASKSHQPLFLDEEESKTITLSKSSPVGFSAHVLPLGGTELDQLVVSVQDPQRAIAVQKGPAAIYLQVTKPLLDLPASVWDVEVTARDTLSQLTAQRTYQVVLTDPLNRHVPQFDFATYPLRLSEATPPGSTVLTLVAVDPDPGSIGELTYTEGPATLGGPLGVFPDGGVYLRRALDREQEAYHALQVVARDGGSPSRSASTLVILSVDDENDHSPVFDQESYVFRVTEEKEGDASMKFVGRVQAQDEDSGRNAKLSYRLQSRSDYFHLDPETGSLHVSGDTLLDRESIVAETGQDFFELRVVAKDQGENPLSATVSVTVLLEDVNDNVPSFSESHYKATVSENTAIGTSILTVEAKDLDSGLNGHVAYHLKEGQPWLAIDNVTGQVNLAQGVDFESIQFLEGVVVARDQGDPALSSQAKVYISILDENDNWPEFQATNVRLELPEDTPLGQVIHKFEARDADLADKLTYHINGAGQRNVFHLDQSTGLLTLTEELDRESQEYYEFSVQVRDREVSSSAPKSSVTTVAVRVLDVNDNAPRFLSAPSSGPLVVSVQENLAVGSLVLQVSALDADEGRNGLVSYELLQHHAESAAFRINSVTGQLTTARVLDREQQDAYTLRVIASDQGEPVSLNSTLLIQLKVSDVNDNTPEIVSLRTALVSPDMAEDELVMRLEALDEDEDLNGQVTFHLAPTALPFSVSPDGDVRLVGDPRQDLPDRDTYELAIVATDGASPSLRRSSTTLVTLLRGHDQPGPAYTKQTYRATIKENSPAGTPIGTVELQENEPNDGAAFYITACYTDKRPSPDLFVVDQETGQVRSSRPLDRETDGSRATLTVVALMKSPPRMSECSFEVHIEDTNDFAPVFRPESFRNLAKVSEALLAGANLAQVEAVDQDEQPILRYSIEGPDKALFSISAETGVLSLAQSLDREKQAHVLLTVKVSDGLHVTYWNQTIEVEDINDNAPTFLSNSYSFDVSETTSANSPIGRVVAKDLDAKGPTSTVSYHLISEWGSDRFALDPFTGLLRLAQPLDFEEVPYYVLVVSASDGGSPPLTATATVYINVINVNDHAPKLKQSWLQGEIWENELPGDKTPIVTVEATDQDQALEGPQGLYYSLDPASKDKFQISSNGTLAAKTSLDREQQEQHSVIVTVSDHPDFALGLGRTSTCLVRVHVLDRNDHPPALLEPRVQPKVPENSPLNTPVVKLKATDPDEGRNAEMDFFLEESSPSSSLFSLGRVDGILRTAAVFDREEADTYTVRVKAVDRGVPRMASEMDITVTITDENDNPPVFSLKQHTVRLLENASVGSHVIQVEATDPDVGALRYRILSGDPDSDLALDESTGEITVGQKLDFERRSAYTVRVQVSDRLHVDIATVHVEIVDVNDNQPQFLDSPYTIYVMENLNEELREQPLMVISAMDKDSAPFNKVEYSLRDDHSQLFSIDPESGALFAHQPLDRESQNQYKVEAIATDFGSPRLSSTGTVSIIVTDENDHDPVIETQDLCQFEVSENRPAGELVGQIEASDADEGANGQLKYQLKKENNPYFNVDPDTGVITTKQHLDREEIRVHEYPLVVSDQSPINPRQSECLLRVLVQDENDNPPRLLSMSPDIFISRETTVPGSFVVGLTAVDEDSGDNGEVGFYLEGRDARFFEVDPENGAIFTSRTFEPKAAFQIDAVARDHGTPSLVSRQPLEILQATEFSAPKFQSLPLPSLELLENTAVGTEVHQLAQQGRVAFDIAGGNARDTFVVSDNVLKLNKSLDYEKVARYELWLKVFEPTKPLFYTAAKMVIDVVDVNDNPPVFDPTFERVSVPEGQFPPFRVTKMTATDLDEGLHGQITYQLLQQGSEEVFSINPRTGLITCHQELDRETLSYYSLKVLAVNPPHTATATVVVDVTDVNDNAPLFTRLYAVNVSESAPRGMSLFHLETSDQDSPANANVTYTLLDLEDSNGDFEVDPFTGDFRVAGPLDREIRDEYLLRVQASDGAWKVETTVTVLVLDENDNAPQFDEPHYTFTLRRNHSAGGVVGRVHALDRDSFGPNSAVAYTLATPSSVFGLHVNTGELSWLGGPEAVLPYQLRVVATDRGTPPRSATATVAINVVQNQEEDVMRFWSTDWQEQHTALALPYDVKPGTRVYTFKQDELKEVSPRLRLAESPYFALHRADNTVESIASLTNLRGQTITLTAYIEQTTPMISLRQDFFITGRNEHDPVFTATSTRIFIREDEAVGSVIFTASASDADSGPNGELTYRIVSGNDDRFFHLDPTNGQIRIHQELDFEEQSSFTLTLEASDAGFYPRKGQATVLVVLQDVNDHVPTFDAEIVHGYVTENAPRGVLVAQLNATDADSEKYSQLEFEFVTPQEHFELDPDSGRVISTTTFDYESLNEYNMAVRVSNPDLPRKSSVATLRVHIVGQNEFTPKFTQPIFQFRVSEAARFGSSVGQVSATDGDSGPDGEVYYYLVGSSNTKGFGVHPRTGVLFVKEKLDRESQSRYLLTVLAKNAGSLRGGDHDEAQIIIQLQDGNDPPEFRKSLYTATLSEDVEPGTPVVTVTAVDKDVRPRNSHFAYSILPDSDPLKQFRIDQSGVVSVAQPLDRETVSSYNLSILAIDSGSPPATGSTSLLVTLTDVNDSPPTLEKTEGTVKENQAPGTRIMQLEPQDADSPSNGAPFTFLLRDGPFASLVHVEPSSGVLTTRSSLDRESLDRFEVSVLISDSGQPPMSSVQNITIEILDENDSPSRSRSVSIAVQSYNGTFPGGKIAALRPNDPDSSGAYECRVTDGPDTIFSIEKPGCTLAAGRIHNGREYALVLAVNDGKHESVTLEARVSFEPFSEEALHQAVPLRFHHVKPEHVLQIIERTRVRNLEEQVEVLSLGESVPGTSEAFVAVLRHGHALSRTDASRYLESILPSHVNISYNFDPCAEPVCLHGGLCSARVQIQLPNTTVTEYQDVILNAPVVKQVTTCQCREGFYGPKCQYRDDVCSPNPCAHDGLCQAASGSSGFKCQCGPRWQGEACEEPKTTSCQPNPCHNGGTCQPQKNQEGFFCLCRPGYHGELCDVALDACASQPCLNGGTCVSQLPNYRCRCLDHFYGAHCELATTGFEAYSYVSFPALDASVNDISVTFTTSSANALLIYNYGEAVSGRSDFLALQILEGKPVLSWGGARTAITRLVLEKSLSPGRWYKVTATRNHQVATLSLEDCTESGEFCKACSASDPQCFAKTTGDAGTLSFHGKALYFGGLNSAHISDVLSRSGQIATTDFIGCVKSLQLNGMEQNLFKDSLKHKGLKNTCNQVLEGPCTRGDECGPNGQCLPMWSHHMCRCGNGIVAPNCNEAFTPVSLLESQSLVLEPTEKFRRETTLSHLDPVQQRPATGLSSSVSFRTLQSDGEVLASLGEGSSTKLVLQEGMLVYVSHNPNINVTTGVQVSDGQWHTVSLEVTDNILSVLVDGVPSGEELVFASTHHFLGSAVVQYHLGGFRGCLANFSLNQELQPLLLNDESFQEPRNFLTRVALSGSNSQISSGCDLKILESTALGQSAVDVGVLVILIFFILLISIILASFITFKLKRRRQKRQQQSQAKLETGGIQNMGLDLGPGHHSGAGSALNNQLEPVNPLHNEPPLQRNSPLVVGGHTRGESPVYDQQSFYPPTNAEHYDLENASSIAPSDIDVVYHYKGFRGHHSASRKTPVGGRSSRGRKGAHNAHPTTTPLARLSPSSELSHATPRILTLQDLSGKPLPHLYGPVMEMEGATHTSGTLHSPSVSHVSASGSNRGLTTDNLAKLNSQQSSSRPRSRTSATASPLNSVLVSTLDMMSSASERRSKKRSRRAGQSMSGGPDRGSSSSTSSSSSSDDGGDDDSFTCSEFEYDTAQGDHPLVGNAKEEGMRSPHHPHAGAMIFNKLMEDPPRVPRRAGGEGITTSDADSEEDDYSLALSSVPGGPAGGPGGEVPCWEALLNWLPEYSALAGVFKDIAELPHDSLPQQHQTRPAPVGLDNLDKANEEEHYI